MTLRMLRSYEAETVRRYKQIAPSGSIGGQLGRVVVETLAGPLTCVDDGVRIMRSAQTVYFIQMMAHVQQYE
jgi:hypothetical protein